MVPHLITTLTGPINELEQRILESMPAIERWFRLEWMEHTPPFYCAVSLRNAGFKLAPVDTDLFPTGFHHLTQAMQPLAVQAAMAAIEKICPEAKNLLLIPDPADRSAHYLLSLRWLMQTLHHAGLNVRLGSLDPAIKTPTAITLPDGTQLCLEPLKRLRGRLGLKNFDPCTIVLNCDLPGGVPAVLQGLHLQYLLPPLHAGWSVRSMVRHFQAYEEIAKKFAKLLGMDPWLIHSQHARCEQVDLERPAGVDAVRTQVDAVIGKVRRKYKEYAIRERPYAVLKADAAAGGRAVVTLHEAKELDEAALRAAVGPGRASLIVQEGVPSYERVNDTVAEPIVYMIDRYVVGGFYRTHAERGTDEVLNGPGTKYVPLAFAHGGDLPRLGDRHAASTPNRFYMYGVIGRLASVAASYELEATDPEAEAYA